ncbi:putative glutamate carboxypeptidase LAMP1 [Porphyridium purpureum]|uniref:Putative glutamate carboxypeptidase LAMP1 n=1 Tax=Porphyridium purpureum TaxID=35688 RepID=A0A5J4Z6G8_PORPP|nr:putative glutamate carboxypeptidase LAMP1 [Porphyridium purpureum]|eukprot:POR3699..scf295_1
MDGRDTLVGTPGASGTASQPHRMENEAAGNQDGGAHAYEYSQMRMQGGSRSAPEAEDEEISQVRGDDGQDNATGEHSDNSSSGSESSYGDSRAALLLDGSEGADAVRHHKKRKKKTRLQWASSVASRSLHALQKRRQDFVEAVSSEDATKSEQHTLIGRFILILLTAMLMTAVVVTYLSSLQHRTDSSIDVSSLFGKFIRSEEIDVDLKSMTSREHMAGTNNSKRHAEYIRELWESTGALDSVVMESFDCGITRPINTIIELRLENGTLVKLDLAEGTIDSDATSQLEDELSAPAFHGYAAAGKVEAQVVYANYGFEEDFRLLKEKAKVSVKGKIVLMRYGKLFRGLKVQNAERAGAAGVLLYSDPADDGFVRGDVYPKGPWRPDSSVQRGSVLYASQCAGDPSTPDGPSVHGAPRVPYSEIVGKCTPSIPSAPISWKNALPILRALDSAEASKPAPSKSFVGGLTDSSYGVTYRVGPSQIRVSLEVQNEYVLAPMYNVLGTVHGRIEPDRAVWLGNHHDAWVFGGGDPTSGTATVLQILRALGRFRELHPSWRPRRSLVFAAWDGEEYNLLGSTEHGEMHASTISASVVAYLNLDTAVAGHEFSVQGSPIFTELVKEIVKDVKVGSSGSTFGGNTVQDKWPSYEKFVKLRGYLPSLGGGSDQVVFQHRLGVSSISLGFEGSHGVYHSLYDSYSYQANVMDPTFEYHEAMAKVVGMLMLRIAEDRVVPLGIKSYAHFLSKELQELEMEIAAAGSIFLESSVLKAEMKRLGASVKNFGDAEPAFHDLTLSAGSSSVESPLFVRELNDRILLAERELLVARGLPGRPWFKHAICAPNFATDYGTEIFPGIRYFLQGDRSNATLAAEEVALVADVVQRSADVLNRLDVIQ